MPSGCLSDGIVLYKGLVMDTNNKKHSKESKKDASIDLNAISDHLKYICNWLYFIDNRNMANLFDGNEEDIYFNLAHTSLIRKEIDFLCYHLGLKKDEVIIKK